MVVEAKLRSPIHSTFEALVVLPQPVGGRKCFSWFLFWLIKMCLGLVKMISNSGSESEITFAPTKYHFYKHLTTFFRENVSTTSRRQKMLSKSSLNPEAWIFML